MGDLEEQRAVIKFFAKTGAMPMECWNKLKEGFGNQTVTPKTVCQWFRKFNSGITSIKDKQRPGHPKSVRMPANIQKVQDRLQQDRCSSLQDLSDDVGIKTSSLYTILKKDLHLSKLAPKFVPKVLTNEQKRFRMKLCQDNIDSLKSDPSFLSRIVTGDKCWVSLLEVELKKDSKEWYPKGTHAERPLKAIRNRSLRKVMVTVFFDDSGAVLVEFLPPGETVNEDYYCEILRTLKERIRCNRPHLWGGGRNEDHKFLLHHDNVSPHTSVLTLALIGSSGIDMVPHPPTPLILRLAIFFFSLASSLNCVGTSTGTWQT